MDNLLKYLLENKNLYEADKDEDEEDYRIEDEDPDVFDYDEESPEDDTTEDSPEGSMPDTPAGTPPEGGFNASPDMGQKPIGDVPMSDKPNEPEAEEPKKRYIGQAGDSHYYIEPKEDGFVIVDQMGTEKVTSKDAGVEDELGLILAARDELKLTTWTDEAMITYFIPAIKEKDETAEVEFARPDLMENPEDGVDAEEPEDGSEIEDDEGDDPFDKPSDEEDIFMEPDESLPESKIREEKGWNFAKYGEPFSKIEGSKYVRGYCSICGDPMRVGSSYDSKTTKCDRCVDKVQEPMAMNRYKRAERPYHTGKNKSAMRAEGITEMIASFKYGGASHTIELVQDHSTKNSIFEIDGVQYKFGPDITGIYRVNHGKFTEDSLSSFGEFMYETLSEDNKDFI